MVTIDCRIPPDGLATARWRWIAPVCADQPPRVLYRLTGLVSRVRRLRTSACWVLYRVRWASSKAR